MDAGLALQLQLQHQPAAAAAPFVAPKSRQGYTRQRQGCLTCRRRKKKCDRCYPLCGHCLRLNLACEREEPRRVGPKPTTASSARSNESSPQLDQHHCHVARIYTSIDDAALRDETSRVDTVASRRAILRYYTTVFASLLSTNNENNCFLSVMLPMAFECSALMKSLVAWASSHLAARDPTFEQSALEHRGSALVALKASIGRGELPPEMCLAVTMVFCSMESISDTSGSWYHHLLGGAAALGHPRRASASSARVEDAEVLAQLSSVEGGWLLRNFAYHDALMSVSMDCRPLISGQYWTTTDSDRADPYFGLASRIILLISQISVLRADMAECADTWPVLSEQVSVGHPDRGGPSSGGILTSYQLPPSHPLAAVLSEARSIEDELLSWSCPAGSAGSPLHLLAESYRSAALLHLYRTLRRHVVDDAGHLKTRISQQVGAVCDIVSQMPTGCLAECTLLFPLFIAGGEAESSAHIETIRSKMETINRYRHFCNVTQALEVLNELWRLKFAGVLGTDNRELDWLDITKSRSIKLAIT